jgi:hypothetical protein
MTQTMIVFLFKFQMSLVEAKPSGKLSQETKLFCFDIDNDLNFFFRNKTFLFFKIEG